MGEWWKKQVVYQIYPRSFCDSNGDGIGDIQGIISKLDYLKDLGITCIWICPMYKSPMADNGYDISDYYAIQDDYGTMQDLEELIAEAKQRNIGILMDLVINHTSDEHAWFKDAIANPNSKYRNYYIFKKGVDGHAPTNWRSVFGGSVWEKVPGEDMYYYHAFAKKQPDLNWENPEMRHEIYNMINWWLEKGIAGFRVDAINFIKKDQRWCDGEVDGADGLSNCFQFSRNREGIEEFFKELRHETFDKHDCLTVAEAVGVPYDQLGAFIGKDGCFPMMFDFNYSNLDVTPNEEWYPEQDWTIKDYKEHLFASQIEVNKIGWSAAFHENHDMPRSLARLIKNPAERTPKAAKLLGALLMFLKATPYIYEGEEIGMVNNERTSIDQFDDISSKSQYERAQLEGYSPEEALRFVNRRSRDNTRSPMCWDDSVYAGFSSVKPWLMMNEKSKEINVEKEIHDSNSVLSFYKQLIALRQKNVDLIVDGTFKALETSDSVVAYARTLDNETLICMNNMHNAEETIDLDGDYEVLLSNDTVVNNDNQYTLSGWQTLVLKKSEK